MTPEILHILPLVAASIQDEPVGGGIADAVAERSVQSKARFINKIVHITFDAAVVVAAKNHPLSPVEKNPACEVDGANSTKPSGTHDVPRRIIDGTKHSYSGEQSHQSRFQTSHRAELIRDKVIFTVRELLCVPLVHGWTNLRICSLELAQTNKIERREHNQQRS